MRSTLLLVLTITLTSCGGLASTPTSTPIPPSPTPTITPTPTNTPTPTTTPTTTPTPTPNATEIVENYMTMLSTYLATNHDSEIEEMRIEAGTLHMTVRTKGTAPSFLRLSSWLIIHDLAQLLQLLGPNTELLIDIVGAEEYVLDLVVLSEDGSLGYVSETSRWTFNELQEGRIDREQWEILANGHTESF